MDSSKVSPEAISVYNKAIAYYNKGDYNTALSEYRRAIEINPLFIEAYNNIGEIYSRMGDSTLAISTYTKALEIKRHYRVLLNLGVEYFNRWNYKTALGFFNESISIHPDFIEGNLYAGLVHYKMNNYSQTEKCLLKVISMDRRHLKANQVLSYIYYDQKQYKKVLKCLDRINDIFDDRAFMNKYYGFCHYHLGSFDKAVEYLKTAMESSPGYEKFRDYLKSLSYKNKMKEIGDIDKKIREMEEIVLKGKPGLTGYTHLSMLYIFKGEYGKAEKLLESVKIK